MKTTHNLQQGSADWHKFRYEHFGASETAAMLGISPYQSRDELLKLKKTGIAQDINSATQRIFDKGHETEALARPILEEILEEDLYPATYSLGNLSASVDGITLDETIVFEHKQYSQKLFDLVSNDEVPEHYQAQCQQILLITGAEKVIFVCSDGTPDNYAMTYVFPDEFWFSNIKNGWEQFEKDLADYVPAEIIEPPKAEAVKSLPMVTVQVRGEISTCNLPDLIPIFDNFLANTPRSGFVTDTDFALAEGNGKEARAAAKGCVQSKEMAIKGMLSVSDVIDTLSQYEAKFNALGLALEKAVKAEKDARKASAKLEREKAYAKHIADLEKEISPVKLVVAEPDWIGAMKNQRLLESLYNKLDTELANGKIAADAIAAAIRQKLSWLKEAHPDYGFLFRDLQTIIYKDAEDFKLLANSRVTEHKADEAKKLEADREGIRQEEEAKAAEKARREQEPNQSVTYQAVVTQPIPEPVLFEQKQQPKYVPPSKTRWDAEAEWMLKAIMDEFKINESAAIEMILRVSKELSK